MKALVCFISIAIFLSCNSSTPGNSKVLKFNLEKGRTYSYAMTTKMENEFKGERTVNNMNFDYDIEVTDDKDGIKTLKSSYKRVVMNTEGAPGGISIDSDHPVSDTTIDLNSNPLAFMGSMFHAMVGKSFIMKVNAEGNITEINGLPEMFEAMLATANLPENAKPMARRFFSSQFNEETLKQSFSQALNIYPNKAVKVGDTWEKKITLPGMAKGSINSTYKVKSITDSLVTLDVNSEIEIGKNKGTQAGTMKIDPGTGLVTAGDLEQKFGDRMTSKTKITGKVK